MKSRTYARSVQSQALRGTPPLVGADVRTLYLALHSQDASNSDDQSAHEIPALARASFARQPSAWVYDGEALTNAVAVTMPKAGAHEGKRMATHWSLGTKPDGAGQLIISGKLASSQEIVAGLIIDIPAGALRDNEF